jgi:hypothetical protein
VVKSPFSEGEQADCRIFPAAHFGAPCVWAPVGLKRQPDRPANSDRSIPVAASLCRGASAALAPGTPRDESVRLADTAAQRRGYNLVSWLKL